MEDVELINKDRTLKETILGESVYFLKRKSPTKDKEKVTPSKVTTDYQQIINLFLSDCTGTRNYHQNLNISWVHPNFG